MGLETKIRIGHEDGLTREAEAAAEWKGALEQIRGEIQSLDGSLSTAADRAATAATETEGRVAASEARVVAELEAVKQRLESVVRESAEAVAAQNRNEQEQEVENEQINYVLAQLARLEGLQKESGQAAAVVAGAADRLADRLAEVEEKTKTTDETFERMKEQIRYEGFFKNDLWRTTASVEVLGNSIIVYSAYDDVVHTDTTLPTGISFVPDTSTTSSQRARPGAPRPGPTTANGAARSVPTQPDRNQTRNPNAEGVLRYRHRGGVGVVRENRVLAHRPLSLAELGGASGERIGHTGEPDRGNPREVRRNAWGSEAEPERVGGGGRGSRAGPRCWVGREV